MGHPLPRIDVIFLIVTWQLLTWNCPNNWEISYCILYCIWGCQFVLFDAYLYCQFAVQLQEEQHFEPNLCRERGTRSRLRNLLDFQVPTRWFSVEKSSKPNRCLQVAQKLASAKWLNFLFFDDSLQECIKATQSPGGFHRCDLVLAQTLCFSALGPCLVNQRWTKWAVSFPNIIYWILLVYLPILTHDLWPSYR